MTAEPHKDPSPATSSERSERLRPRTWRLVLSVALLPLVPGTAFAVSIYVEQRWSTVWGLDRVQFWTLLITGAMTWLLLCIWRACVVWTAGRSAATVVVTAVPIAQVLWWQPLWSVGCLEDLLVFSQSLILLGLWIWGVVWLWWGWDRYGGRIRRRLAMTDSTRRVLQALALVPLIVGGYWMTDLFMEDWLSEDDARLLVAADVLAGVATLALLAWGVLKVRSLSLRQRVILALGLVSGGLVLVPLRYTVLGEGDPALFVFCNVVWGIVLIGLWLGIWRSFVDWSPRTQVMTIFYALGFLIVVTWAPALPRDGALLRSLHDTLAIVAWGVWEIATVRMWRYRPLPLPAEVENLLRCQTCGYNLRGLCHTRCPECGAEPTLDELMGVLLGTDDA